jgi:nitroreductase
LDAAFSAPSASDRRPWHFIIIDNREILDAIPKFHPYSNMLKNTNQAILVCGDLHLEKSEGYLSVNCSAATENILITAHAKELGACWLGVYPRKERINGIKKLLNLPEHILPISLISLGYPAEHKDKEDRYDENRVHYNKW